MRTDIASLNPGGGNANDAISRVRTADALAAVIDEKRIRMKKLAGQAVFDKSKAHSGSDNLSAEDAHYMQTVAERQVLWGLPVDDPG